LTNELREYFARPETPAAGSPVGVTMVKILEKFPEMGFEEARAQARELLSKAAGSRIYRLPRVLSAEEQEAQKTRLKKAFRGSVEGPALQFPVYTSVSNP